MNRADLPRAPRDMNRADDYKGVSGQSSGETKAQILKVGGEVEEVIAAGVKRLQECIRDPIKLAKHIGIGQNLLFRYWDSVRQGQHMAFVGSNPARANTGAVKSGG